MVPILALKISAPAEKLIEALPVGCQLCMILGPTEIDTVAVQVQITGEPQHMEAVRDVLTRLRIELGDAWITVDLPHRDLITAPFRLPDQSSH